MIPKRFRTKGVHNSPKTEFKRGEHHSPKTEFKKGQTSGSKNCRWNGGQKREKGYVYIFKSKHPSCTTQGYIKRSRFIMENLIGRYLNFEEIIHHRNEVRNDDRPENLYLCVNRAEHNRIHKNLAII